MPTAPFRPPSFSLRAALIAAMFVAFPLASRAAEKPAASANVEVVSLPPLIVEEKSAPLKWRYVSLPGLEILSVCNDSTTLDFARRHHRLEELLGVLVPARLTATTAVPEAHILFNQETGRARSQEVLNEMLTKSGAKVTADGLVTDSDQSRSRFGGPPRQQRLRFLPNMRLWDLDATIVFSVLDESGNAATNFTFAPDRIAFLLERRTPALPEWFTEGTMALYVRAKFDDDEIVIAPALWTSTREGAALSHDPEYPRTLLPIQEMFTRRRPPASAEATAMDRVWRAQSALFVRWAFAEKTGARKEALWKFIERLEREPFTEALFREHFGLDFAEARDRLSDYLATALIEEITLKAPKPGPLPRLRMRPATDLEIARIRGGWERMEIAYVKKWYPDLAEKYIDQARLTLHRAYDRGERDPALVAELGLTEVDAGSLTTARTFLTDALKGDFTRPRAAYELGRIRYKSLSPAADAKLTAEQTSWVLAPLLAGRFIAPPLADTYMLISDVWTFSSASPTAADLAILTDGVRLFPSLTPLVMRAAYLHAAAGQLASALDLIDTGLRANRDLALRARLEQSRTEIAAMKK